jgi:hypothetical protein
MCGKSQEEVFVRSWTEPDIHIPHAHSFGQDSEFFLWDPKTNQLVPSWKHFQPKGAGRVFRDGLAVEVNCSPATCRAFIMNDVRAFLRQQRPPGLVYTSRPIVTFDTKLYNEFPPDVRALGCNPTLNAYTEQTNIIRVNPAKLRYRTSGAHLHMSFKNREGWRKPFVPPQYWANWVKAADLFLGVLFTAVFNTPDEFQRRKLYGRAGEFRHQEYPVSLYKDTPLDGLEYRVLSSRIWDHPAFISLALGIFKVVLGNSHFIFMDLPKVWDKRMEPVIRRAINTGHPLALETSLLYLEKMFPRAQTSYRDTVIPALTQPGSASALVALLRTAHKQFASDAGWINEERAKEAHYGWNDYRLAEFKAL